MIGVRRSFVLAALLAACGSPSEPEPQVDVMTLRIAVSNINGPIRLSTVTGTPERILIPGIVNAQDWAPSGDRLVYVDDRGSGEYALSITDTLGNAVQLPVPLRSTWPQYSHDGAWIYFFTQNNQPPRIMRIRPDGSGLQDLMAGRFPSASPDGTRIAAVLDNGIWVGNPVTQIGSIVPNTTSGIALRWSPDGQWLAYRSGISVVIIRPDGSGKRVIPASSVGGLSWSPDSRYLLSGSGDASQLQLIDTNDDSSILLPVTGVYPAWKPVP